VILEGIVKTIADLAIVFSINKTPLKRGKTKDEVAD
jgi:hypothetical protein